ncbi:hypothetical protein Tco_0295945, partial [Tanacetum coccineum]
MFGRRCICLFDLDLAFYLVEVLGVGDLGVATPRALVYAGVMTGMGMLGHGIWNVVCDSTK